MSNLILHTYDMSPFTQRVLRMLGFKRLEWHWVETPIMLPKPDLTAMTGGYRGTPVLQIGSDIYIDSQLIALELERRHPTPSLFPEGEVGLALAFGRWSDAFFRSGLRAILGLTAHTWPSEFREDRRALFPDIDFATVASEVGHWGEQFRADAALLEAQLKDGRDFLSGARPGLCDANAHPFVAMMRGVLPALAETLFQGFHCMAAWEKRVTALGEGHRVPVGLEVARDAARLGSPGPVRIDAVDAEGFRGGERVSVIPVDSCRGSVSGILAIASSDEIAVDHQWPGVGAVRVHFPRIGYRITL